jgi:phytoene/squalene synthetase
MTKLETYCATEIKRFDYDRYLVTLFAPSTAREHLFALYAFNHEIAKIREAVSEPMLGEIRLQWWREAIEGIFENKPRNHEVVLALHKAVHAYGLPKNIFDDIINMRTKDIYDEPPKTLDDFEQYLGGTSGNLNILAARILNQNDETVLSMAYDMGQIWGLIGTVRSIRYHMSLNKLSLPQDLMEKHSAMKKDIFQLEQVESRRNLLSELCQTAEYHLDEIAENKSRLNKHVMSIFLLASLGRSYLAMMKKADYNPFLFNEKAGTFQRQCRLFYSAVINRL